MVLKLLKSRLIPVDISGLDTARNLNTFFMFSSSSWSRIPFENTSIYHIKDTCMGFYLNTYTTISMNRERTLRRMVVMMMMLRERR